MEHRFQKKSILREKEGKFQKELDRAGEIIEDKKEIAREKVEEEAKQMIPQPIVPPESCGLCKYFSLPEDNSNSRSGDCRRYPPSESGFPTTRISRWCGEYVARP